MNTFVRTYALKGPIGLKKKVAHFFFSVVHFIALVLPPENKSSTVFVCFHSISLTRRSTSSFGFGCSLSLAWLAFTWFIVFSPSWCLILGKIIVTVLPIAYLLKCKNSEHLIRHLGRRFFATTEKASISIIKLFSTQIIKHTLKK